MSIDDGRLRRLVADDDDDIADGDTISLSGDLDTEAVGWLPMTVMTSPMMSRFRCREPCGGCGDG